MKESTSPLLRVHRDQEDMMSVRDVPPSIDEELLRFMVLEFRDDKVKLRPYEETLGVLSSIHPTTSLTLARSSSFRTGSTYRIKQPTQECNSTECSPNLGLQNDEHPITPSSHEAIENLDEQNSQPPTYVSEMLDQTMLEEIEPHEEQREEETDSRPEVDYCVKVLENTVGNGADNTTPRFPLMNRKNLATFSPEELNYRWSCEVCGITGLRSRQYWSHCLEDEHRRQAEAAGILIDAERPPPPSSYQERFDAVSLDAENSANTVIASPQPDEADVCPDTNTQAEGPLADRKIPNATWKGSPMVVETRNEPESVGDDAPVGNFPVGEVVGSGVEASTKSVDDLEVDLSMEMKTMKDPADEHLDDPLIELDSVGREESLVTMTDFEWNPPPTNEDRIWTSSIRSLLLCPRTPTERRRRFSADVWENVLESVEREQSPKKSHLRRRSCPEVLSPVSVENINRSISFADESPSFNLDLGGELEGEETDLSGELNESGGFGLLARLAFFA